eukprot:2594831-Prymnesium_polylepis.2
MFGRLTGTELLFDTSFPRPGFSTRARFPPPVSSQLGVSSRERLGVNLTNFCCLMPPMPTPSPNDCCRLVTITSRTSGTCVGAGGGSFGRIASRKLARASLARVAAGSPVSNDSTSAPEAAFATGRSCLLARPFGLRGGEFDGAATDHWRLELTLRSEETEVFVDFLVSEGEFAGGPAS